MGNKVRVPLRVSRARTLLQRGLHSQSQGGKLHLSMEKAFKGDLVEEGIKNSPPILGGLPLLSYI